MNKELIKRIRKFNEIKYSNDNETRIIIATLKPRTKDAVTTAPNIKE